MGDGQGHVGKHNEPLKNHTDNLATRESLSCTPLELKVDIGWEESDETYDNLNGSMRGTSWDWHEQVDTLEHARHHYLDVKMQEFQYRNGGDICPDLLDTKINISHFLKHSQHVGGIIQPFLLMASISKTLSLVQKAQTHRWYRFSTEQPLLFFDAPGLQQNFANILPKKGDIAKLASKAAKSLGPSDDPPEGGGGRGRGVGSL
ncbi:hypothetical protein EDC04DRAFT_2978600 [Pisolithus marmoratus]|nr:hypothetical protein EDC04DRAFT_2978600 [Pisolithus marmoratus]